MGSLSSDHVNQLRYAPSKFKSIDRLRRSPFTRAPRPRGGSERTGIKSRIAGHLRYGLGLGVCGGFTRPPNTRHLKTDRSRDTEWLCPGFLIHSQNSQGMKYRERRDRSAYPRMMSVVSVPVTSVLWHPNRRANYARISAPPTPCPNALSGRIPGMAPIERRGHAPGGTPLGTESPLPSPPPQSTPAAGDGIKEKHDDVIVHRGR